MSTTTTKNTNINAQLFADNATGITVMVNGMPLMGEPRQFSSGSWGWYINGKVTAEAGKPLSIRINDSAVVADWKQHTEGKSYGWFASGKARVQTGEITVDTQVSGNITVVKSKDMATAPTGNHPCQIGLNIVVIGSKGWTL